MTAQVISIVGVPRPLAIDRLYIESRLSDVAVSKAAGVGEVAQIARAEVKLRQYLEAKWEALSREALRSAVSSARAGKSASTIIAKVGSIMRRWGGQVEDVFVGEIEGIYNLGRIAAYKKASKRTKTSLQYDTPNMTSTTKAAATPKVEVKFDLADEGAKKALIKQQLFWIGDHYDKNVSGNVAEVTRKVIVEAGGDRNKAGQALQDKLAKSLSTVHQPDGWAGSSKQYFEGVVANAATVARAHSQMRSFLDIGITKYTIVNPLDERTCERCHHMDGKVFSMKDGADQMHAELKAKNPNGVRAAHPWLGAKQLTKLSTPGALAKAGQSLPPFHFRCRCTVDISDDIGSWDDLEPMTPPTEDEPAAPAPEEPAGELAVRSKIEEEIRTAKVLARKQIGVGVNGSEIATLETSEGEEIRGVWKAQSTDSPDLRDHIKAGTYHKREAAVSDFDALLGEGTVVPPTVARKIEGELGSLQAFDKEAVMYEKAPTKLRDMIDEAEIAGLAKNESARRMYLLDVISGNDDRHGQNIMYKLEDKVLKLVAIDNGLTFPEGPACRFIFPTQSRAGFGDFLKLDDKSIEQVNKLDLATVAGMLKKNGLTEKAIRPALVRIKALQMDPNFVEKVYKKASGFGEKRAVETFIEQSAKAPKKMFDSLYIPKKQYEAALADVDAALEAAFK